MKILLIDHHPIERVTRKVLIEEQFDCQVDSFSTAEEIYSMYQKNVYEVVLIDNAIKNIDEYVEYIFSIDKFQKILVISDATGCIVDGCDNCINSPIQI